MALLNVDLGSSDVTLDDGNANSGDTIAITALASNNLTVDGIALTINSLAGVSAGSNPSFTAINGATLTFSGGLAQVSAIDSMTFNVGDSSSIIVEGSLLTANLSAPSTINFSGTEDGFFNHDPALGLLGTGNVTYNVNGLEEGDRLGIDGRSNLTFSYNSGTGIATLRSNGGALSQTITYNFAMDSATAQQILDNPSLYIAGDVFVYPAAAVICFARGTLISTIEGVTPIENLREGDLVLTRDHGFQPVQWIGSKKLRASGHLAPIRIRAGALGNHRDLIVSPQHRILVKDTEADLLFGIPEALMAAKHLVNDETVLQEPAGEVEYFHMIFDRHQVIYAEGLPCESFHPGEFAMTALDRVAQAEILELFPALRDYPREGYGPLAYPTLRGFEAKALSQALYRSGQHRQEKAPLGLH